jgi:hypothetical protein
MSTLDLDLYSFADLRRHDVLAGVGRAFDADPALRPELIDVREPIRNRIVTAEGYFANSGVHVETEDFLFERRQTPRLSGAISAPAYRDEELKDSPHRLYAFTDDTDEEWLADPANLEALARLFVRLAGAFDGSYGFAADAQMARQQRGEFARMRQRRQFAPAPPDETSDRHSVRDVYWLNYFGPAHLERWGERVAGLGVRQERTSNGGVVIWATDTPDVFVEDIGSFMDYPWKQPFYRALGRDSFVNALSAAWDRRVPSREDHLRHVRG